MLKDLIVNPVPKFLIFGTDQCPYCQRMKRHFDIIGMPYEYLTIHRDVSIEQLNAICGRSVRSAPVVLQELKVQLPDK